MGIAFAPYHLQAYKTPIENVIKIAAPQCLFFYAWQRGQGAIQMPGVGPADFTPWLRALAETNYSRYLSIFMHGHAAADEMEASVAKSREYLLRTAGTKTEFKQMFNGKDLTGWNTTGNWIVEENNTITLKPRPGEQGWKRYKDYLTTDRKYGDFVLDLEFKFNATGNSGVFMRVGDLKDHVSGGFEVQILDTHGKEKVGAHDCGGVIGTAAPTKNMVKPTGQWNRYTITLIGHSLKVVLNGEQIINLDISKSRLKDRPSRGYISFQDEAKRIWYRNVRIKELKEAKR